MKKLANTKVLVSIIIPYHKKRNFFSSTIKSIKNQILKNYEVIIVYDDKNHEEVPFVKKQIKQIKNKKLVINKKIIGPGLSRNIGIKLARGKYISFCDADDTWKKNKLSYQTNFMIKNNLKFSHSNYNIINFRGNKIGKFKVQEKINYKSLLKSCDIGLSTVMIEKNFLYNYKFCSLRTKEDYYLWLRLAKKLKILHGINKYLVDWRSLEDSLSSSKKQRIKDAYKLYNYYENYNSLISFYYVLRLSFYSLIKKIQIYF